MVLNIAFDFLASVEAIGSATAEHTISAGQSPCKKKGVASVSALSGECHIFKMATPIESCSPVDCFSPHGKSDLYSLQSSLHIIAV